jgi:hypothetical protein
MQNGFPIPFVNDGRGNIAPAQPTIVSAAFAEQVTEEARQLQIQNSKKKATLLASNNSHVRAIVEILEKNGASPAEFAKVCDSVSALVNQLN